MLKSKLLYVTAIVLLLSTLAFTPVAAAGVKSGQIESIYFPDNFPTAKSVPNYGSYLLENTSGQTLNVVFLPYSGTGPVTITASSDAFTGDASVSKDITTTSAYYTFALSFNIKSGIDGSYSVNVVAKNDVGATLDSATVSINVWLNAHEEAAQQASTALTMYYLAIGYGPIDPLLPAYTNIYVNPVPITTAGESRALLITASKEISLAQTAYGAKDWSSTITHAQNATNYISQAGSAEKASVAPTVGIYLTWVIYILIIALLAIGAYAAILFTAKLRKPPTV